MCAQQKHLTRKPTRYDCCAQQGWFLSLASTGGLYQMKQASCYLTSRWMRGNCGMTFGKGLLSLPDVARSLLTSAGTTFATHIDLRCGKRSNSARSQPRRCPSHCHLGNVLAGIVQR